MQAIFLILGFPKSLVHKPKLRLSLFIEVLSNPELTPNKMSLQVIMLHYLPPKPPPHQFPNQGTVIPGTNPYLILPIISNLFLTIHIRIKSVTPLQFKY